VQLYSAATANGIKVAAALEEIKVARARKGDDFDYEPHTVRIRHGESRMDFFKEMNPHGKIPVVVHEGITVFESGAILMYLAERFDDLLPTVHNGASLKQRYETIAWFQWASSEFSGEVKQLGYYFKYCTKREPFPLVRQSALYALTHTAHKLSIYSFCSLSTATLHREGEATPRRAGVAAGLASQHVPPWRALHRWYALLHR
tara:strand:+ start:137 stop:745 length:609 start_codon:yes stop_codon:yes gene_type:complete